MVIKRDFEGNEVTANSKESIPLATVQSRPEPYVPKVHLYLIFCCMTVSLGSFQFGYNMASLNPCTDLIKHFIRHNAFIFSSYNHQLDKYSQMQDQFKANNTIYNIITTTHRHILCQEEEMDDCSEDKSLVDLNQYNQTISHANLTYDQFLSKMSKALSDARADLDTQNRELENEAKQVAKWTNALWAITHTIFSVGGMIGALCSKYFMDWMGRKGAYLFHNLFGIAGALCVLAAPYTGSPVLLMVARLLYGIQSGSICSIAPTFLNEISHASVRGRIGVMPQLNIVFGVLLAQILGLSYILGAIETWHLSIGFPLVPALLGNILMILFFPETPAELLSRSQENARIALVLYRGTSNVDEELNLLKESLKSEHEIKTVGLIQLITLKEIRWPLIVAIFLQIGQQLCGVNALFFYSSEIFQSAHLPLEHIQYAILATGVVRFLITFAVIPLIDRLGRRILTVWPVAMMIVFLAALVTFMSLKEKNIIFPYLSIVCILFLIILFSVSLGPIPHLYAAECFKKSTRSSALALCITINWICSVLLTISFPFLATALGHYVFLIFIIILGFIFVLLLIKMRETKNKTAEEIIKSYNKKGVQF